MQRPDLEATESDRMKHNEIRAKQQSRPFYANIRAVRGEKMGIPDLDENVALIGESKSESNLSSSVPISEDESKESFLNRLVINLSLTVSLLAILLMYLKTTEAIQMSSLITLGLPLSCLSILCCLLLYRNYVKPF